MTIKQAKDKASTEKYKNTKVFPAHTMMMLKFDAQPKQSYCTRTRRVFTPIALEWGVF